MKRRQKRTLVKSLALCLCSTLLFSSIPAYALEEDKVALSEQEAVIPVEAPTYSFLFQYDQAANKTLLLHKMQEIGTKVQDEIDYMRCITAEVTMEQLAQLKEMACVKLVERNWEYSLLSEEESVPEGLSDEEKRLFIAGSPKDTTASATTANTENISPKAAQSSTSQASETPVIPFEAAHAANIKGQNMKVAVFDTGITEQADLQVAGGVSFVGDRSSYSDNNGHGTQMAGIIAAKGESIPGVKGPAPEADIYAVKLAQNGGFINTAGILMGIEWAMDNGIDVVNMSFGSYFYSKLLESALELASSSGILFVAAAGNDGGFEDEYRIMYPAAYESVVAVGAGSAYGTASFSNCGEKLDFVAPGRMNVLTLGGQVTDVTGTSASAAYVSGLLTNMWSSNPTLTYTNVLNAAKSTAVVAQDQAGYVGYGEIVLEKSLEITAISGILKTKNSIDNALILFKEPISKAEKNSQAALDALAARKEAAQSQMDTSMPVQMASGNCFANEMASAIPLYFNNWTSGYINCPGNEVWYRFTANKDGNHPGGSPGLYGVSTVNASTNFDTQLYLYDSSGNQLAYNDDYEGSTESQFWVELDPYYTYYIRVKGWSGSTGRYHILLWTMGDDHGNTIDSATTVTSVYYEDNSVSGHLHSQGDVDYFAFVPARDCVMEIYTEGSTNTTGTLYDECENQLIQTVYMGPVPSNPDAAYVGDDNGNGNGNFKITAHLKAMQFYYIAVSHSTGSYGDYTLKFKFVKDYHDKSNYHGSVLKYYAWISDDEPTLHNIGITYEKVFVPYPTAGNYKLRVIDGGISEDALEEAILTQNVDNIYSIIGAVLSYVPIVSDVLLAIDLGMMINGLLNNELSYATAFNDAYQVALNSPSCANTLFIEGATSTMATNVNELVLHKVPHDYQMKNGTYIYGPNYTRGVMSEITWPI